MIQAILAWSNKSSLKTYSSVYFSKQQNETGYFCGMTLHIVETSSPFFGFLYRDRNSNHEKASGNCCQIPISNHFGFGTTISLQGEVELGFNKHKNLCIIIEPFQLHLHPHSKFSFEN